MLKGFFLDNAIDIFKVMLTEKFEEDLQFFFDNVFAFVIIIELDSLALKLIFDIGLVLASLWIWFLPSTH